MLVLNALIVLLTIVTLCDSSVKMTNLICTEYVTEFATFENCRLKLVKRGEAALNIYVKLLQLPVSNITFNLSLHKKFNGYRPFLYNVTVDFCQYQRNQRKYLFPKVISDLIRNVSNINHTCPYNHDIVVENLLLKEDMFKILPLPMGDYMFQLKVGAYNEWKADIKLYIEFRLSYAD